MEKREPALAPQWLKAAPWGVSSSNNLNHHHHHLASSSHSDDIGNRPSLRHISRSSSFTDRTSSSSNRKSVSSNGSSNHDRDSSTRSQPYSSFGRNKRDKDRENERSLFVDNGYLDYFESFASNGTEKDALQRSQSMIARKRSESCPKRPDNNTRNGALSARGLVGGVHKPLFERDFPSLGSEEKQGPCDIARLSSPGLSTAVQNLPLGSSAIIGGEGWTSALAEVPAIIGVNGPILSSVQQSSSPTLGSTASSMTTGLNMAETLAKAPSRDQTVPQLSVDTRKLEELAIKQSRQLIPVTPSMPKSAALSSSEKLKSKGSRSGDINIVPKLVPQSSSQPVNHSPRGRPDVKSSQVGNFHVLNRERNGLSPTAKEGQSPANASRVANPPVTVSAVVPLKSTGNPKVTADKTTAFSVIQNSALEKRPLLQVQKRSDFFNSLRKKPTANQSTAGQEHSSVLQSSISQKSSEQITVASAVCMAKDISTYDSNLNCLKVNSNGVHENCDVSDNAAVDPEMLLEKSEDACLIANGNGAHVNYNATTESELLPGNSEEDASCSDANVVLDEEEEKFLQSLGWEKHAKVQALTEEEIAAFYKELDKQRSSKTVPS